MTFEEVRTKALGGDSLTEWEGNCLELADRVLHVFDSDAASILHIEHASGIDYIVPSYGRQRWGWHAVAVLDGLVYDLWDEKARPVVEYLRAIFPRERLIIAKNGDNVFTGYPEDFDGHPFAP